MAVESKVVRGPFDLRRYRTFHTLDPIHGNVRVAVDGGVHAGAENTPTFHEIVVVLATFLPVAL